MGADVGVHTVFFAKKVGERWEFSEVTRSDNNYDTGCLHVDADFYAFWADGHARDPSPSRLYFCDRTARSVFRLPAPRTSRQIGVRV